MNLDYVTKVLRDSKYDFTHVWVDGFGWETTIMLPSDFDKIRLGGLTDDGQQIFFATNKKSKSFRKFKGMAT